MIKKFVWSLIPVAMALFVSSRLATAQQTIFSDLGQGNDVYNCCVGWTVSGTGTVGTSFTAANEFTAMASGSVLQIDIAVGYVTGTNSFFAALYTANNDRPGTLIQQWNNLSSNTLYGSCCGLVTIFPISGVFVTAGTPYFLIVGPTDLDSTTWEAWNWNNQGVNGIDLYATSGCQNGSAEGCEWISNGSTTLGAFDVIGGGCCGTPEPSSLLLLGSGLLAACASIRCKRRD